MITAHKVDFLDRTVRFTIQKREITLPDEENAIVFFEARCSKLGVFVSMDNKRAAHGRMVEKLTTPQVRKRFYQQVNRG